MKITNKNYELFLPVFLNLIALSGIVCLKIYVFDSTDYFMVFVYFIISYIVFLIIMVIDNFIVCKKTLLEFMYRWWILNMVYIASFIIMGIFYSTVLSNNMLNFTPFIFLLLAQILIIVISLLLNSRLKGNEFNSYISKNKTIIMENFTLLIPFVLVGSLLVNSSFSEFRILFLYVFFGINAVYLIYEVILYSKYRSTNILRIIVPVITLSLIVIVVVINKAEHHIPGSRLNSITLIAALTGPILFYVFDSIFNRGLKNKYLTDSKSKSIISIITYFLSSIIFFYFVIDAMIFLLGE